MSTRAHPAPVSGALRMRRALALAGCGVLSVGMSACESTEQESSRIGRESEAAAHAAARTAPQAPGKSHGATRSRGRAHTAPRTATTKGATP